MSSGGVRHLHALPVFFRREGGGGGGGGGRGEEGEEKRRGGGEEGLDENKSEMKAFLEATKELYTGKGSGEPSMGLKNTQTKLGKEEGMPYSGTGPLVGSKSQ